MFGITLRWEPLWLNGNRRKLQELVIFLWDFPGKWRIVIAGVTDHMFEINIWLLVLGDVTILYQNWAFLKLKLLLLGGARDSFLMKVVMLLDLLKLINVIPDNLKVSRHTGVSRPNFLANLVVLADDLVHVYLFKVLIDGLHLRDRESHSIVDFALELIIG